MVYQDSLVILCTPRDHGCNDRRPDTASDVMQDVEHSGHAAFGFPMSSAILTGPRTVFDVGSKTPYAAIELGEWRLDKCRGGEKDSDPRVPESSGWSSSYERGHPIKIRRPECEASHQQIQIRRASNPVVHTFRKRVPFDPAAATGGRIFSDGNALAAHTGPPFPGSSSLRRFGPNRR